ncbi:MAG: hypothetical protein HZC10_07180 [Nitrospirae bacterium]|nr:hypothetical protein [Nitrospirota bacterium]
MVEWIEVIKEVISNFYVLVIFLIIVGFCLIVGVIPLHKNIVLHPIPEWAKFKSKVGGIILIILCVIGIGIGIIFFLQKPFEVKITTPKKGDEVSKSIKMYGTFSGKLPERHYLWVVVNPEPSPNEWWPQGRIDSSIGDWEAPVSLGREKEDIGAKYTIAIIMVDEKDDRYFEDYQEKAKKTSSWPGIPLPGSKIHIDKITVKRK